MIELEIVLYGEDVNTVLAAKGLEYGHSSPSHALLQLEGTRDGKPSVIFVAEHDGKQIAVKTTLAMLQTAVGAMVGAVQNAHARDGGACGGTRGQGS